MYKTNKYIYTEKYDQNFFFLLNRMHNSKNHEHHCSRVVVLKQFLSKKTSSHETIHVRPVQKIGDGFAALVNEGALNPGRNEATQGRRRKISIEVLQKILIRKRITLLNF